MAQNRQSARLKGLSNGRGGRAPVAAAASHDPIWGTTEPSPEKLAAKKAAIAKRNEEYATSFVNATQGSHPTIFEAVDTSDTCTEHLDALKHPPRRKRPAATKISNPYVTNKKRKPVATKQTTLATNKTGKRSGQPPKNTKRLYICLQ